MYSLFNVNLVPIRIPFPFFSPKSSTTTTPEADDPLNQSCSTSADAVNQFDVEVPIEVGSVLSQITLPMPSTTAVVDNDDPAIDSCLHDDLPSTSELHEVYNDSPTASVTSPFVSSTLPPISVSHTSPEILQSQLGNTLDDTPHQPCDLNFPQREFGKKKYRFQAWFRRWPWLHCIEDNDTVLCHTWARTTAMELPSTQKGVLSFVETGFSGWKKANESENGFTKHKKSTFHKNATSM